MGTTGGVRSHAGYMMLCLAGAIGGCTLTVTPAAERLEASLGTRARSGPQDSTRPIPWPARATSGLPIYAGGNVFPQFYASPKDSRKAVEDLYWFSVRAEDNKNFSIELQPRSAVIGPAWVRWFGSEYPDARSPEAEEKGQLVAPLGGSIQVCTWRENAVPDASGVPSDTATASWFEAAEKFAGTATFRQDLSLHLPTDRGNAPVKGLAIVLSPLTNQNYLQPVIDELQSRGWALLVQRRIVFALTEPGQSTTDMPSSNSHIDPRPQAMARVLDANLADQAYAIEAALAHWRRIYPEVLKPETPTVLVGFSLGAIVGVTTAARMRDQLDAAVFVGGGALAGPVLVSSQVFRNPDGTLTYDIPEQRMPAFELDYLAASRLDSYSTAPWLKDLAVLQVDGATDGTVKPRYANILWERLGRPERWTIDGGHAWLFLTMDQLAPDIVDWVERAAPPASAASPTMLGP